MRDMDLSQAKQQLQYYQQRINKRLEAYLPEKAGANALYQAMRYSLFAPSKRLRPALVYAATECFGGHLDTADYAAASLECMHTFSLIHDDLPAMDDDDLRRGLPSAHCVYGDDIAILAGDALLSFSFELLSQQPIADHLLRKSFFILARDSGKTGMALGQAMDCQFTGKPATKDDIITLQNLKTGALFEASLQMGAISAGISDQNTLEKLHHIGQGLGLIFQLKDDLLDIQGTTETLGKPAHSDEALDKPSYPYRFGCKAAEDLIQTTYEQTSALMQDLNAKPKALEQLAALMIYRNA